jgi:hypothetical protein
MNLIPFFFKNGIRFIARKSSSQSVSLELLKELNLGESFL